MALDAELLSLRSAGTYRFERDISTISNDTTTFVNLRLVVGFSKIGPFNTPNLVTSQADFIKLYGNIDRSLEKRGSYFHRSALVALSAGPILCLNLLTLDPDNDQIQSKSFSVNIKEKNKYTITLPLNSVFNTDKFWFASDESFLDAIEKYLGNSDVNSGTENYNDQEDWTNGVLHFTNVGKKPLSILIKKANLYNSKGYELTLNEWYGEENVPEYLNGTSYVSDYLVEVYVVGGDFGPSLIEENYESTNFDGDDDGENEILKVSKAHTEKPYVENPYHRFASDIIYQSYFDKDGFIRKENDFDKSDTKLNKFLNLPSVNLMAKYVGSLIPNFVDKLGRNIWIQKLVNDDVNTLGLLCAEDISLIENVEADDMTGYINEKIDIIGHNIYNAIVSSPKISNNTNDNTSNPYIDIEMLSYKCKIDDAMQTITINKCVLNSDCNTDLGDSESECDCFDCIEEKEFKYIRMIVADKDHTEENKYPYAWVLLNEDGTIGDTEIDVVYSNSSYIENTKGVYVYDVPNPDATMEELNSHLVLSASKNKSIINEYSTYDSDPRFVFVESNLEDFNPELNADVVYKNKNNEAIVEAKHALVKGDYIVSFWKNGQDETIDPLGLTSFSRLTRIVRTSKIYAFIKQEDGTYTKSNDSYVKVVCSDNIWRTGRSISDIAIVQIKTIDDTCERLHWTCLKGFKISESSMPNGENSRQDKILDMLRENPKYNSTMSNLFKALIDRDYIQWRYLVDTFGLGLEEECKSVYTLLCQARKSALAIINCPSQLDFKKSIDPSFTNKSGSVDVEYIANGGNLEKNPIFLYSLPSNENGASFGAYYYPYLRISDLSAVKSVPPAPYVSNLFIQKYTKATPWSIVAGQKRGVISGNQVIGVEATLIHDNRDWLEPAGINSIIWENGVGVEVYANKTAKQTPRSALSSIHVRECCIYIQDNVESILRRYVFEYNTAQTRLEIKTLVDEFLENVKNNGGVYEYKTVMDTTNNTQEVIDNNQGVIDIYIEPVRGLEILTQRLTVMKTGGIATGVFE